MNKKEKIVASVGIMFVMSIYIYCMYLILEMIREVGVNNILDAIIVMFIIGVTSVTFLSAAVAMYNAVMDASEYTNSDNLFDRKK